MKTKNGITLIALIITIIVMLILVGVTINLATNGGLFEKSRTASKDTEQKKILEELIAMAEFDNDGKIDVNSLTEKVEAKYDGSTYDQTNSKLTVKGNKGEFYYKVTETEIKIWEENDGGNDNPDTKTLSELYCDKEDCTVETHLHKGDYVLYNPSAVEVYKPDGDIEGRYTGYTSSVQSIKQEKLNWRVLGKAEDHILLISETPTTAELSFYGYIGYNNYEDVLNNTCKNLYSNTNLRAIARSINMEDIDKYLGGDNYNKTAYDAGNGGSGNYGYTKEIASKFNFDSATNKLTKLKEGEIVNLKLTSNAYYYEVTNDLLGEKNREILLGSKQENTYSSFVASRAIKVNTENIEWCMADISDEEICIDGGCCYSDGSEDTSSRSLRPIVLIPANVSNKELPKK